MYVNMAYQCNLTQIKAVNSEKKKKTNKKRLTRQHQLF